MANRRDRTFVPTVPHRSYRLPARPIAYSGMLCVLTGGRGTLQTLHIAPHGIVPCSGGSCVRSPTVPRCRTGCRRKRVARRCCRRSGTVYHDSPWKTSAGLEPLKIDFEPGNISIPLYLRQSTSRGRRLYHGCSDWIGACIRSRESVSGDALARASACTCANASSCNVVCNAAAYRHYAHAYSSIANSAISRMCPSNSRPSTRDCSKQAVHSPQRRCATDQDRRWNRVGFGAERGKKWASAGESSGQGVSARGGSVRLPDQSRQRRNARDHPVRRLTLRCHAWAGRCASTQLRRVWASPAKPFAVHEKVPSDVSWNASRSRRARSHFFGTKTRPMSRPAVVTFPVGDKRVGHVRNRDIPGRRQRVDHVRKVAAADLKRTFGILPVEYLRVGLSQPMLCATKDVCTKPVASPGARLQAARTKS